MRKLSPIIKDLTLAFLISLGLGAALAACQPGAYWNSWFASSTLLWICLFVGICSWKALNGDRKLAVLLIVTFSTRLVLGVVLHQVLPQAGFDTEVQRAGYVYSDAFKRDQVAWQLAASGEPLGEVWTKDLGSDQYGGLLFLSTLTYRLLSMDTARPLLITILGAFCMTIGLAFLFSTLKQRWSERVALTATWFLALYPEGALLGSSQMREPFLIGFFCLGLWAVLSNASKPWKRWLGFAVAALGAAAFSIPAGMAMTAILIVVGIITRLTNKPSRKQAVLLWAGLGGLALVMLVGGWLWVKPTLYYDAYLTETSSGMISMLLKQIGEKWQIPFVAIYGLAQPVLPAAITDPSLPIWMILSIWRGLGWYFFLPFMLYSLVIVWKSKPFSLKWLVIFLLGAFLAWVAVSSMRAGGDQWDNPRYRAIFLPVQSLLFGWAVIQYRERRDAWFWVFQSLVWVDALLFTLWYLPRHGYWGIEMPFFNMIVLVGSVSVLFVFAGLGLTLRNKRKSAKP
jgi:hypothetical protein